MWDALLILACAVSVHGHGRLVIPPGRASAWRAGFNSPANYDDNGLNCGGFYRHWELNGGKCGVCGDAYDLPSPRPHEIGGIYGQGHIVAKYQAGNIVPICVYLTASHLGYWEFRICPDHTRNDQACFDQHLIELEEGGTKYYPLRGSTTYLVNYRIPMNLTCDHCVLQWKYTAGNNWGVCADGKGALGCGNQETFFSCSDVSIERPDEGNSSFVFEAKHDHGVNENIASSL